MSEILADGLNYVDNNGDVKPVDHPHWIQPELPLFDHEFYEAPDHESWPNPNIDEQPGASIDLSDRAIAIEGIMNYFNQANKAIGLAKSRGYSSFDARYGREASEVASGMNKKEQRLYRGFMQAVNSLVNPRDLQQHGFTQEAVEAERAHITRTAYHRFGPGRAYAPDRAKEVRRLKNAAKKRTSETERLKR